MTEYLPLSLSLSLLASFDSNPDPQFRSKCKAKKKKKNLQLPSSFSFFSTNWTIYIYVKWKYRAIVGDCYFQWNCNPFLDERPLCRSSMAACKQCTTPPVLFIPGFGNSCLYICTILNFISFRLMYGFKGRGKN